MLQCAGNLAHRIANAVRYLSQWHPERWALFSWRATLGPLLLYPSEGTSSKGYYVNFFLKRTIIILSTITNAILKMSCRQCRMSICLHKIHTCRPLVWVCSVTYKFLRAANLLHGHSGFTYFPSEIDLIDLIALQNQSLTGFEPANLASNN